MITKITDKPKQKKQPIHPFATIDGSKQSTQDQELSAGDLNEAKHAVGADEDGSEAASDINHTGDSLDASAEIPDNVIVMENRSSKPWAAVILLLIVALAIGGYFYLNRTYKEYVVDTKTDRSDETEMEYLSFQGGFIKYNVDGITFEDKGGTIIWTEALTMTDPKVVVRGEYVAVTDVGDNQYILYNTNKKIGNFKTDYPITDIQVAEQGLVSVVLEDEKTNYIVAFDVSGKKNFEIKTTISKNGYPMAIAMSEDGTKLVASYVTINGTKVENALTFYNFGNVGKNEVDRQVGYKKFGEELFPHLEFVNNDTVCAFGDSNIVLYSMKQKPKEVKNIAVEEKMKSVFYNSNYVGYVTKLEDKSNHKKEKKNTETHEEVAPEEDDAAKYQLNAFSLSGRRVLQQDIDFNYNKIHSTSKEIVLVSNDECEIYKYNGALRYKEHFENGIMDFFPTTSNNKYVLVTTEEMSMVHLK